MSHAVRLNKFLADHHYGSRREADRLIQDGYVFINNVRAHIGQTVTDADTVRVIDHKKRERHHFTYLLVNKPAGISVSLRQGSAENILGMLKVEQGFVPVGSLDTRDEGLVMVTDDSVFAKKCEKEKFALDQEFVIETDKPLLRGDVKKLQNGIRLKDGMTKPMKVRQIDEMRFAIVLAESKPDLIRRMCEALGYKANAVIRSRFLTLKMISTYPVGSSRSLTESEITELKKAVGIKIQKQKMPPRRAARFGLHRK